MLIRLIEKLEVFAVDRRKGREMPTITMRPVQYQDGSWGVELTVTGLENEHQAEAAMLHMERLFCAAPIQTQ